MSRHHLTDTSDRLSDFRVETASSPNEDGPGAEVSAGGQWWVPGALPKFWGRFVGVENTSSFRGKMDHFGEISAFTHC